MKADKLINILDDDGDVSLEKGNIILFPSESIEKDIIASKNILSSDSEDDNMIKKNQKTMLTMKITIMKIAMKINQKNFLKMKILLDRTFYERQEI